MKKEYKLPDFPYKLLTASIILTIITLIWSVFNSYEIHYFYKDVINESEINDKISNIIYLDEVLTMSATIYVSTGDEKWKNRYIEHEKKLDDLLKELFKIYNNKDVQNTINANENLVQIEKESIALVPSDKKMSYEILSNSNYINNKKIYFESIINIKNYRKEFLEKKIKNQKLYQLISILTLVLLALFTILLWAFLFKITQNSQIKIIRINKKLRKSIKNLNKSNQALEAFAHACAHEFKEPIRNISNLIKLYSKNDLESKDNKKNRELKLLLDSSIASMDEMIDSLLYYSKAEHIKTTGITEFVNLENLIRDILAEIKLIESGAKVEIISSLPEIRGEHQTLNILFKNFLTNALKYKQPDQDLEIKIDYKEKQDFHEFSIKDNGIGIEEEYKNKIFKLFFRISSNPKGSGIGLSLCRRIIDLYQGSIKVISAGKNQGCEFIFTIKKYYSISRNN